MMHATVHIQLTVSAQLEGASVLSLTLTIRHEPDVFSPAQVLYKMRTSKASDVLSSR